MNLKKNHNIYVSLLIILLSLIGSIVLFLIYFVNTNLYFNSKMNDLISSIYEDVLHNIEFYAPKILFALIILLIGLGISVLTYKFIFYLFKKFNIVELIDKLTLEFTDEEEEIKEKKLKKNSNSNTNIIDSFSPIKLSQKIKIDKIVAKASAYYVFLLFFRLAIYKLNITDVENFLDQLITYLPNLFIGFMIGFFGVRFADFIYDIIYHTLEISGQRSSKVLASGGKLIVLFFTVITVLDKVGITSDITNTIFIGFISMLTIAGGIAFGLGGRDVAKEILESLKK